MLLEAGTSAPRASGIPQRLSPWEMQRSSVLLVLQLDSLLQIPAKFYEYVATGRPPCFIGGEGATANPVERHALGISSPNQLDRIKLLLSELASGRQNSFCPTRHASTGLEYRSLTGELVVVLNAAHRVRSPK